MEMVQEITLPGPEALYTIEYAFDVTLVDAACRAYAEPPPGTGSFPLALDAAMGALLEGYGDEHRATLDDIATASIQFFRTSDDTAEALDHIELRFLLNYDFGRLLTTGQAAIDGTRLGPATRATSMRHGEAVKRTSEMFGYGLALHYVAKALGVSTDWFTFVLEPGARPDFAMARTPAELVAANPMLQTLGPSGQRVYVEVKSRMGWASMREAGDVEGLLLHCARKAAACADGIFLAVLIALPARSDSPRRTPHIFVADPNSPNALPPEEQAAFLLERYLMLARRYGLDLFRLRVLQWLADIAPPTVSPADAADAARLSARFPASAPKQPFLPIRTVGDRRYQGRYFYTLVERLGTPGSRRITLGQATAAIEGGDIGGKYFAGVDLELFEIVSARRLEDLLAFGVRGKGSVDLAGKSAFVEQPLEPEVKDREEIVAVVKRAVDMAKLTRRW